MRRTVRIRSASQSTSPSVCTSPKRDSNLQILPVTDRFWTHQLVSPFNGRLNMSSEVAQTKALPSHPLLPSLPRPLPSGSTPSRPLVQLLLTRRPRCPPISITSATDTPASERDTTTSSPPPSLPVSQCPPPSSSSRSSSRRVGLRSNGQVIPSRTRGAKGRLVADCRYRTRVTLGMLPGMGDSRRSPLHSIHSAVVLWIPPSEEKRVDWTWK